MGRPRYSDEVIAGREIPKTKDFENLIGRPPFGRWTVVSFAGMRGVSGKRLRPYWNCKCACGTERAVDAGSLQQGTTESCGCLRDEITSSTNSTHGMTRSPEFRIWQGMINRCYNKNHHKYKDYGGRGIGVCERWMKFENFYADMKNRPSPKHSIGRIKNNEWYSPENCRWETPTQQARNRRTSKILTVNGEQKTLAEWAEASGKSIGVIHSRLKSGWSEEDAVLLPVRPMKCSH